MGIMSFPAIGNFDLCGDLSLSVSFFPALVFINFNSIFYGCSISVNRSNNIFIQPRKVTANSDISVVNWTSIIVTIQARPSQAVDGT